MTTNFDLLREEIQDSVRKFLKTTTVKTEVPQSEPGLYPEYNYDERDLTDEDYKNIDYEIHAFLENLKDWADEDKLSNQRVTDYYKASRII